MSADDTTLMQAARRTPCPPPQSEAGEADEASLAALLAPYRALAFAYAVCLCLVLLALPDVSRAQPLPPPDPDDGVSFRVLAFHDVRENVRASFETDPDETAVDENTLTDVFAWLQHNGYHPVSLQQIIDARGGGARLPKQPVLLTFDDGYRSAYTKVFPLLKRYNYPGLFGLVTSWLEVPEGGAVPYGTGTAPRSHFLSWAEAAEMARSPLVELASHSHAMHTGVQANPQGNLLPLAAAHRYDPATRTYENDASYSRRVEDDLRRSRELIEARTGARARVTVWPYGAYNALAVAASQRAGLPYAMKLTDGPNDKAVPLTEIRRALVVYRHQASDYAGLLRARVEGRATAVNRVMHVDLDYVYDPDPVQQEKNLGLLIDRVAAVNPATVFLQAFSDPDGDGVADALYFPNRHLPMRADLFSRAAWQLETRAGVNVYAWMPVMAFRLPAGAPDQPQRVLARTARGDAEVQGRYHRLSPFDPKARALVTDIYDDLGRHAFFNGVLYHDDATLGDDEDASEAALAAYRSWGLPGDIDAIRADPALMARWTAGKTRALIDFTAELTQRLRAWRPVLTTARNLYAAPLLDAAAEARFAQNYEASLAAYDYVALMAMPRMEELPAADADAWLARLARRAAGTRNGLDGTLFELQAMDWRTGRPVPDAELARQVRLLQRLGVRNIGYYPDDFIQGQPSLKTAQAALSMRSLLRRALPGKTVPKGAPAGALPAVSEAGPAGAPPAAAVAVAAAPAASVPSPDTPTAAVVPSPPSLSTPDVTEVVRASQPGQLP